jgi:hypothetical protein
MKLFYMTNLGTSQKPAAVIEKQYKDKYSGIKVEKLGAVNNLESLPSSSVKVVRIRDP